MTRTQQYLFYAGVACLVLALIMAGVAVLAGPGAAESPVAVETTTPSTLVAEEPAPPTTDLELPTTTQPTTTPVTVPGPTTTIGGGPSTPGTTGTTSGQGSDEGEEPPPAGGSDIDVPAGGSAQERIRAVADQVGFPLLALEREGWTLTTLEAGRDGGGNPVVVLIYEQGDDFLNINQRPQGEQPPLGANSTEAQARGTTVELQDMVGLYLARWDEGGATVLISSTVGGDRLLRLIESLQPIA